MHGTESRMPSASIPVYPSPEPCRPPRPAARLFGQFLVHEGVITADDLDEALSLMAATNTTLGELAVSRGLLTRADADAVQRLQEHVDGRWGELALRLQIGGLTKERLEELFWEQQTTNLRLTDALVELGVLSASEVEAQLRRFEDEQDAIDPVGALPRRYRECPPVPAILAVLPKLAARLLRNPLRISPPRRFSGRRGLPHRATARMRWPSASPLDVDDGTGVACVEHMRTVGDDDTPSPFVGRFVTRLCDLVARRLADDGLALEVDVPVLGSLPRRGVAFDLALGDGSAVLVLSR